MYVKITRDLYSDAIDIMEISDRNCEPVSTGHYKDSKSEWWILSDKSQTLSKLHELHHTQFNKWIELIDEMDLY